MLKNLLPTIFAWIGVIVTLALAPTIETYNSAVTTNITAAVNKAYFIGMTAIDDFGGFIMIASLLLGSAIFARGFTNSKASLSTILPIVGQVIGAVVVLALFSGSAIGYFDSLVTAGSGVAKTFYGVLVTVTYVLIISSVGGYQAIKAYRGRKRRSSRRYI